VIDVALIGLEGAGKSDLALGIVEAHPEYNVIDGYAQEVQEYTGIALGPWATYVGNLVVVGARLEEEIRYTRAKQPFITCGTIVETILYFSQHGGNVAPPTPDEYVRVSTFMGLCGNLIADMWGYGYVAYLPLPEDHPDKWIDQELATTLDILGRSYDRLDGSYDERLDQALEGIASANAAAADLDERGVRESRDTGEAVGDSPGRVPDVRVEAPGSERE
jgi:hypothetical protein